MLVRLKRLSSSQKLVLGLCAAAILSAAGWFAWWTISPLFINRTVSEALGEGETSTVLREGSFQGADSFHQVAGTALILEQGRERILRLESDFSSTNGPDLYVWLVKGDDYRNNVLDLGRLKGNQGSQNYVIPETVDLTQYDRVIIWCRAFSVLFGSANL